MREDYRTRAKRDQHYTTTPKHPTCGNCESFVSDQKFSSWVRDKHPDLTDEELHELGYRKIERNLRCGAGGFAVKKTASCAIHRFKKP